MEKRIEDNFNDLFKHSFEFAKKNVMEILKISAFIAIPSVVIIFGAIFTFFMSAILLGDEVSIGVFSVLLIGSILLMSISGLIGIGCAISMIKQFKETGNISYKIAFKDTWKNKWRLLGITFVNGVFNILAIIIMVFSGVYLGFTAIPVILALVVVMFLVGLIKNVADIMAVYKGHKVIKSYKLAITVMFKVKGAFKYLLLPIALIGAASGLLQNLALNVPLIGVMCGVFISIYAVVMSSYIAARIVDQIEF